MLTSVSEKCETDVNIHFIIFMLFLCIVDINIRFRNL